MTDVSELMKYTKFTLTNPESLEQAQRVYDAIRMAKDGLAHWRKFDFEVPGEAPGHFDEWPRHFKESGACHRIQADRIPQDDVVAVILTLAEGLRA